MFIVRAYYMLNLRLFNAIKRSVEWVPPFALLGVGVVGYLGVTVAMDEAGQDTTILAMIMGPLLFGLGVAATQAQLNRRR